MSRQLLHNGARDFKLPLRWLIRIGCRANGNLLAVFYAAQLLPQQVGGVLLDVNLLLEIHAVAHLHKFVGVARVAIFAGELAAAIRIDRPGKRHTRHIAAVEQRTHRQGEVLYFMPEAKRFAGRRQPGNADQPGLLGLGEQGKGSHGGSCFRYSFAYYTVAERAKSRCGIWCPGAAVRPRSSELSGFSWSGLQPSPRG